MNLKEGVFAFRNVRLVIHFFFHLMLGVTHLLLEKDFSSANLTELWNNRDTMQDFQGIFKIRADDDDHSRGDIIPTPRFYFNFNMMKYCWLHFSNRHKHNKRKEYFLKFKIRYNVF